MEFWIFFVCVCIGFVFLERLVPERYKKFVPMALMFFITFISAFRYRIGWDYQSYEVMFYGTQIEDVYPEITFRLLAIFLRDSGFDFQMIFVVYSLLTSLFIWKGLKYYFGNDTLAISTSIASYALIRHLYWNSLVGIRQYLALAIFFWGCKFIIQRNFIKYFLLILIATLIHFSSVVLIACYFIPMKSYSRLKYINFLLMSIILSVLGIPKMMMSVGFSYIDIYSNYLDLSSVGLTTYIYTFLWMIIILLTSKRYKLTSKQNLSLNMYTLGISLMWLFSFSNAIYRISYYFQIFQSIQIVFYTYSFKNNYKNCIGYMTLLVYAILFLSYIRGISLDQNGILHPYISANNINYTFNFKLFQ